MKKKTITSAHAELLARKINESVKRGDTDATKIWFARLKDSNFKSTAIFNLTMADSFDLLGDNENAKKYCKSVLLGCHANEAQKLEAKDKLARIIIKMEKEKEKRRRSEEENMWLEFIDSCKQKGETLYKELLGEGSLTTENANKIIENLKLAYDFTGSDDAAHMLLRIMHEQGKKQRQSNSSFIKINIYEGDLPFIFVSYAHKDNDIVLPVIQSLQEKGFRVWLDQGIEVGTEWPSYIANHLNDADCILVFMSENAENSKNCRNEINLAEHLGKDIVVIHMDDYEMDLGMQLQIGSRHALYRTRHITYESFIDALCNAKILANCKEWDV